MRQKMDKKAFTQPEIGVFYLVPDPKTKKYSLVSEFDKPGHDSAHFFLWERVARLLKDKFKKKDVAPIWDTYTGLPRGRISTGQKNEWLVLHGDDFPMDEYKSEILSEFSLNDANSIGKVKWVIEPHEKMGKSDQSAVEKVLGISIDKKGFKVL